MKKKMIGILLILCAVLVLLQGFFVTWKISVWMLAWVIFLAYLSLTNFMERQFGWGFIYGLLAIFSLNGQYHFLPISNSVVVLSSVLAVIGLNFLFKSPKKDWKKRGKDAVALDIIAYGFCGIIALVCLVPFIMIVSGSFSSESAIIQNGFSLLPQDFSLEAYKTVFKDPMVVFRAYGTTIGLTIVGTVLGLLLQTMTAYVLSRKEFEWRNQFSFFFYFTTLFSGGLVPYYVLMTQTLNLRDSYLALLLPLLFSVYNLLIMKSYIVGLPDSLIEAAKIDGCGEFRILFRIVMPLIKPALATVGLFIALAYWNDWYNAMLYIKDTNKYPLQYFLYQQVNDIEAYKKLLANNAAGSAVSAISLPTQSLKMALTIVVTGPIVLAYPLVQKYFVQGITIGAVKG